MQVVGAVLFVFRPEPAAAGSRGVYTAGVADAAAELLLIAADAEPYRKCGAQFTGELSCAGQVVEIREIEGIMGEEFPLLIVPAEGFDGFENISPALPAGEIGCSCFYGE